MPTGCYAAIIRYCQAPNRRLNIGHCPARGTVCFGNAIVANLGIDPDIWGSVLGMVLMFGSILVIPFLDRRTTDPRGWAFSAMAIFRLVLILGLLASAIIEAG